MSAEFQGAMNRTINHSKNTFCFLDDILIVSEGEEAEHAKLVEKVLSVQNNSHSREGHGDCRLGIA